MQRHVRTEAKCAKGRREGFPDTVTLKTFVSLVYSFYDPLGHYLRYSLAGRIVVQHAYVTCSLSPAWYDCLSDQEVFWQCQPYPDDVGSFGTILRGQRIQTATVGVCSNASFWGVH